MTRRNKFDCVMLHVHAASHPKFSRLTDSEWRATVGGILPLAGMATIRGRLLIADQPVEAQDVAHQARVPLKAAQAALEKLRRVGFIVEDPELQCEMVHDFDDWNPAPKEDKTSAERQARHRDKLKRAAPHNDRDSAVSNGVTNADVTPTEVEVEGEGEVTTDASHPVEPSRLDTARHRLQTESVTRIFDCWREQTNHPNAKPTGDRLSKVKARLREGYTEHQILQGIEGAAKRPTVSDAGQVYDDLALICRSGEKLDSFIARADLPAGPGRPAAAGESERDARDARRRRQSEALVRLTGGAA